MSTKDVLEMEPGELYDHLINKAGSITEGEILGAVLLCLKRIDSIEKRIEYVAPKRHDEEPRSVSCRVTGEHEWSHGVCGNCGAIK